MFKNPFATDFDRKTVHDDHAYSCTNFICDPLRFGCSQPDRKAGVTSWLSEWEVIKLETTYSGSYGNIPYTICNFGYWLAN